MIILLKSYLRKITVKFNIFLLTILFLIIFLLLGFFNYYTNVKEKIDDKYSYVVMISSNDIMSDIKNISDIKRIRIGRAFISDDTRLVTNEVITIGHQLGSTDYIIPVFPISYLNDYDGNLANNTLLVPYANSADWLINSLNKKIGASFDLTSYETDKKYNLTVSDYYGTTENEFYVNDETFNTIKDNNLYIYYLTVQDRSKEEDIYYKIIDEYQNKCLNISTNTGTTGDIELILNNLISAIILIIILFSIIYILIIKSLTGEYSRKRQIMTNIGYNKLNIFKYEFLIILILLLISLVLSLLFYQLAKTIINNTFLINVMYPNSYQILFIITIAILIGFVIALINGKHTII